MAREKDREIVRCSVCLLTIHRVSLERPHFKMDRRRRAASSTASTSKAASSRRERRSIFRRLLSYRETVYALISLFVFIFVLFVISILDSHAPSTTVFPKLSTSARAVPVPNLSGPHYHASGSAKRLGLLLKNLTATAVTVQNVTNSPVVVTVAVNYAYRNLALNFVCNLKRLSISNYLILAMDNAVYQYLAKRKANVFFHTLHLPESLLNAGQTRRRLLQQRGENEDIFGSSAFIETSRRKSLLVLKVLRLGYTVVFSDVDVVWVRNPIPALLKHPSDFVLQSDRSYKDEDSPLNYNLNSGLYLARSSPATVSTMQAIIKYAQAIRRSEQKAFNYVLCGAFKDHHAGPGLRIGSNQCMYVNAQVSALALPLESFPNGSDETLWNSTSNFATAHPHVLALHANYASGRAEKVDRLRSIGFWFHSDTSHRKDECAIPFAA